MEIASIDEITQTFESASPQDVIAWAVGRFRGELALACSFGGPSGLALVDMLAQIDPTVPVYYLDTGLLFAETYAHVEAVAKRYGIRPIAVRPKLSVEEQARQYGAALWERDPDACCGLRKVEPQRDFLQGYSAWISGIRRDQSSSRSRVHVVERDKFGLIKVNALATWTEEMVWAYVHAHDVPYNPLLERGYRSIGCTHCTLPVAEGEAPRAGRWRGFAKTECGLHA